MSPERWLIAGVPPGLPLPELPAARVVGRQGRHVHVSFDPRTVAPAQLIGDLAAHLPLRDLYVVNPPIEEIVARLYKGMQL